MYFFTQGVCLEVRKKKGAPSAEPWTPNTKKWAGKKVWSKQWEGTTGRLEEN